MAVLQFFREELHGLAELQDWIKLYSRLLSFHGIEAQQDTALILPWNQPELIYRTRILLLAASPARIGLLDAIGRSHGLFAALTAIDQAPLPSGKVRQSPDIKPNLKACSVEVACRLIHMTPSTSRQGNKAKIVTMDECQSLRSFSLEAALSAEQDTEITLRVALIQILRDLKSSPHIYRTSLFYKDSREGPLISVKNPHRWISLPRHLFCLLSAISHARCLQPWVNCIKGAVTKAYAENLKKFNQYTKDKESGHKTERKRGNTTSRCVVAFENNAAASLFELGTELQLPKAPCHGRRHYASKQELDDSYLTQFGKGNFKDYYPIHRHECSENCSDDKNASEWIHGFNGHSGFGKGVTWLEGKSNKNKPPKNLVQPWSIYLLIKIFVYSPKSRSQVQLLFENNGRPPPAAAQCPKKYTCVASKQMVRWCSRPFQICSLQLPSQLFSLTTFLVP